MLWLTIYRPTTDHFKEKKTEKLSDLPYIIPPAKAKLNLTVFKCSYSIPTSMASALYSILDYKKEVNL